MYAHLLSHIIAGNKVYMVVITRDATLIPFKHYRGVLTESIDQAFDVAASHNAPLMEGGKELLHGNFS